MGLNVSLNLQDKKALVVGGGRIALHKAVKLVENGARVAVIAPKVLDEFQSLGCRIELRPYQQGDEAGFFVVVCATDDTRLNLQIFENCDRKGILCLSVSNPSHFSVSAAVQVSGISVSVSTDGKDPGYANHLCNKLACEIDEKVLAQFNAHAKLRQAVHGNRIQTKDKRALLARALYISVEEIETILERGAE